MDFYVILTCRVSTIELRFFKGRNGGNPAFLINTATIDLFHRAILCVMMTDGGQKSFGDFIEYMTANLEYEGRQSIKEFELYADYQEFKGQEALTGYYLRYSYSHNNKTFSEIKRTLLVPGDYRALNAYDYHAIAERNFEGRLSKRYHQTYYDGQRAEELTTEKILNRRDYVIQGTQEGRTIETEVSCDHEIYDVISDFNFLSKMRRNKPFLFSDLDYSPNNIKCQNYIYEKSNAKISLRSNGQEIYRWSLNETRKPQYRKDLRRDKFMRRLIEQRQGYGI